MPRGNGLAASRSGRLRSIAATGAVLALLLLAACGRGGNAQGQAPQDLLNDALKAHTEGRLDDAKREYQGVLDKDATNQYALYNLGLIAQTREQYDEAIVRYTAALAVDPTYAPALYNGCLLYTSPSPRD